MAALWHLAAAQIHNRNVGIRGFQSYKFDQLQ